MPAGRVEAIWVKRAHRLSMDVVDRAVLDPVEGIAGNVDRSARRQVTLLGREAWTRTMSELGADIEPSARRANVLVSGIELANTRDRVLSIGPARLLIGGEVTPCNRMNDVRPGLQSAMLPEWRGGVFAQILRGSEITVGDTVEWRTDPAASVEISCHKAELSDVESLGQLRSTDESGGASTERMMRYLAGDHHPQDALPQRVIYFATRESLPVAYIAGHLTRRFGCEGELQWIYVTPSHRNRGVAAMLLRRLAIWFVQRGARQVCVNVDPVNTSARAFYQSLGAEELSPHWLVWKDIGATV